MAVAVAQAAVAAGPAGPVAAVGDPAGEVGVARVDTGVEDRDDGAAAVGLRDRGQRVVEGELGALGGGGVGQGGAAHERLDVADARAGAEPGDGAAGRRPARAARRAPARSGPGRPRQRAAPRGRPPGRTRRPAAVPDGSCARAAGAAGQQGGSRARAGPRTHAARATSPTRAGGGDGAPAVSHHQELPGTPLNGPDDVVGDPAAVEAALLRADRLAVDRAAVHRRRVDGDGVAQPGEGGRRVGVGPPRALGPQPAPDDGEVVGPALPLAHRRPGGRDERARRPVLAGEVPGRRVAGLQHPPGARRPADLDPAEHDDDLAVRPLQPRRARVVPDRLLAGAGRLRDRPHRRAARLRRRRLPAPRRARPALRRRPPAR